MELKNYPSGNEQFDDWFRETQPDSAKQIDEGIAARNLEFRWVESVAERAEMLEQENAIKLKQILDLEDILYATRGLDLEDGSACWCYFPAIIKDFTEHDESCTKAREATKHLWKKEIQK